MRPLTRRVLSFAALLALCLLAPTEARPQRPEIPLRPRRPGVSPVDSPVWNKVREYLDAKPLEPAAGDDAERKLLKERHNAAVRVTQARIQEFESGRGTLDAIVDAFRAVRDSRVALAAPPADGLPVLELYLGLLRDMEKVAEGRFNARRIGPGDLDTARIARIDAELAVVRARKQAGASEGK
jgi:hypothetical protein